VFEDSTLFDPGGIPDEVHGDLDLDLLGEIDLDEVGV
jgi:hypothetical protein